MRDASFSALIKIDLDVVSESAFEVQLLHCIRGLIRGRVRHGGLAQTDLLASLVESHGQLAGLHVAILAADLLELLLAQLHAHDELKYKRNY